MKKQFTYLTFILFGGLYLLLLGNSSGGPPQTTGAPDESTCGQSNCHNVTVNQGSATIELNFDNGGGSYAAGETYPIAINLSNLQNDSRNGFQIVALDSLNNNAGSWMLTDEMATQLRAGNSLADRSYVTHTFNGVGQTAWSFNWQAPDELIGAVTFYLSVNDANANGSSTGDDIYITNLAIEAATSTSTTDFVSSQIEVFPNPTRDLLSINYGDMEVSRLELFHTNGQLVLQSAATPFLDLSNLAAGVYFLSLTTTEGVGMKKIILK